MEKKSSRNICLSNVLYDQDVETVFIKKHDIFPKNSSTTTGSSTS